jgi:RNA recognition motif-containing protein
MNIYVGNLHYEVTKDDLRKIFSEFGEVGDINLIVDRFSGQSKGFGFLEMPDNSQADAAIKALNKSNLKGRDIKVNQVEQRRKKRLRRRPRY